MGGNPAKKRKSHGLRDCNHPQSNTRNDVIMITIIFWGIKKFHQAFLFARQGTIVCSNIVFDF